MNRYLLTPGPVPVSQSVASASAVQLVSHRGAAYRELFAGVLSKLAALLKSSGPTIVLPSSGTGALEALSANFSRPGVLAVSVSCGTFGDRFREIFARYGADMINVDVTPGTGVEPSAAAEAIRRSQASVLLLTMNETSTGVLNPIADIIAALPARKRPLVLVDGVSGVGVAPCFPEEQGIDGLAFASQKGLMTAPGLGFVWLSPRAWKAIDKENAASYYFDLKLHKKYMKADGPENPYTPPVSLIRSLDAALDEILAEPEWFALRARAARSLAAGIEALGFSMFVKDKKLRSPGVTAFSLPGANIGSVVDALRTMGVEPAGGVGEMKGKVMRVAHYNDVRWPEISLILGSLYAALGGRSLDPEFMQRAFAAWEA